ncbi:hypothetical protein E1263_07045 [Kribbella antibiotica]|uniref:Secreted protein n=1 Tax=Kribbella antibiotica TaxID=190195 RepID=A0A4R4ZT49_9ACTN|nr:hypothetical protein [Kribbella antibiotica]TDD61456.1 hypothetical protein E1263_07045 [Kribbella antibiotica]
MRLNSPVLVAVLALLTGLAVGVAQSPNCTSLTTTIKVLVADSAHPVQLSVPLPYREPPRPLLAPVPAAEFDSTWPLAGRGIGHGTDHAAEDR